MIWLQKGYQRLASGKCHWQIELAVLSGTDGFAGNVFGSGAAAGAETLVIGVANRGMFASWILKYVFFAFNLLMKKNFAALKILS